MEPRIKLDFSFAHRGRLQHAGRQIEYIAADVTHRGAQGTTWR